ncbi:LYR motif containing protein 1 isoform X2 [Heterodontus francisci]|uniref:LYR motif containing protein 1 isoform X2 n=1 Tax=Heterodontus francisci TaxID=7792 RepID=UPI00355B6101
MTATRCDVLGLYRRIFRIARTWQSLSGLTDDTLKEKEYIITEARSLFRKNKNLTDVETIKICIQECHARIEMGLHYRIPYPRPAHNGKLFQQNHTQARIQCLGEMDQGKSTAGKGKP